MLLAVSSSDSIVSSSGVSVGKITSRILGSAYSPSTACIDQVCDEASVANTPAHSKEAASSWS